ncbi:MAG: DctP family TRAP transporter solute-binding subunit [Deltaproteobacteria bacterium]|jgi:tripartite ATP-independent transporter DctP family solute receptor|nr:DctP family TRAP transporter solute-binding subunit [Deltaproteobacteria bacterium]
MRAVLRLLPTLAAIAAVALALTLTAATAPAQRSGKGAAATGQPSSPGGKPAPAAAGQDAAAPREKLVLRAGQVLLPGHPIPQGLEYMAFLLDERSGGEISLEIRPPSELDGERDLIESIQMGELDVIVITTAPLYGFTTDFLVFDLPYVFPDQQTARRVLDGPYGERTLKKALQVGLVGLAYFENGLRHVTTGKTPVSRPEDLAGLKIRTMETRIHMAVFRKLGATPVPLAFGDLYSHLKKGAVDAEENPVSVITTTRLQEVQGYLALTGHFYMPAPLFISAGVWNRLPDRHRVILQDAARDAMHYHRAIADRFMGQEALDELSRSMTVNARIDRGLWRRALASVREDFKAEIGPETLEELDREILKLGPGSVAAGGAGKP